ncbi:MAG: hypothetical protein JXK07_08865 [Spirochaetes bacterium]|nr:hypothetical protein [Spirochaetota bacterium]
MAYNIKKLLYSDSISKRIANDKEFEKFVSESLNKHIYHDIYVSNKDSKELAEKLETPEESKNVFSLYTQGEDKIIIYTRDDRFFTAVVFPHEILLPKEGD